MRRWPLPLCCVTLLAALATACDDGGGGGDDEDPPTPDIGESDGGADAMPEPEPDMARMAGASVMPDVFRVPAIGPDQTVERLVTLRNTGDVPLEVTGFALDVDGGFQLLYQRPDGRPIIALTFAGQDITGYPIPIEPGEALELLLEHRPPAAGVMPSGSLTVTLDPLTDPIIIPIEAVDAVGQIAVDPLEASFGRVPPGETAEITLSVSNIGQAPLELSAIQLQGDMDFSVSAGGADPSTILGDPDGDGMPGLAPGGDFELTVTYAPVAEGLDEGTLSIVSDDLATPDLRIPLRGNDTTGCVLVEPGEAFTIDYDPAAGETRAEVRVGNCGGQPLTVDNVRFRPGTPPEVFTFAEGSLPEFPATLEPGSDPIVAIIVVTPGEVRVYDGALQVFSNDPQQPRIDIEFQAVPPGGGMDDMPPM